jgi:DNA-binding NarL/FixJ family response regulator
MWFVPGKESYMPVNIVLADDHEVVRQGLRTILKARPEWNIAGEAENGQDTVRAVQELRPDVLILDITMPVKSGLEVAQELSESYPDTRVLIFTMHDSKSLVKAVRKAGARGYVLKSRAARDLIRAVEALLNGDTFFAPDSANPVPDQEKPAGGNLLLCQAFQLA